MVGGGSADPFRHHPQLRGLITDPEVSFFRSFRRDTMEAIAVAQGLSTAWCHSADEIERLRRAALAAHEGDLWVFAYGSLMWDPAVRFTEVRRARIEGYHRSFCLVEANGGRGMPEAPGLVAALDQGGACDGLVFRLAAATLEEETPVIWHREQIGPGYEAVRLAAETAQGAVEAIAFVADHDAPQVEPEIDRARQVRYAATGRGVLGSTLEYIETVARNLEALGIEDGDVMALLGEARAYRAAEGGDALGAA